jgi:hypothetical protein
VLEGVDWEVDDDLLVGCGGGGEDDVLERERRVAFGLAEEADPRSPRVADHVGGHDSFRGDLEAVDYVTTADLRNVGHP